jgi:predicted DNA-binding antitoxin AbrB/MazE fold protein
MTGTVQAVYENGVLRLLQPLDLPEHGRVIVTIACDGHGTLTAAVPSTSEPFVSYEGFDPLLDELSLVRTIPNLPIDFSGPIPEGQFVPEVEHG